MRIKANYIAKVLGPSSLRRRRLTGIGIPIINLRRSSDRLRFIMGILILIRRRLLSEYRPCVLQIHYSISKTHSKPNDFTEPIRVLCPLLCYQDSKSSKSCRKEITYVRFIRQLICHLSRRLLTCNLLCHCPDGILHTAWQKHCSGIPKAPLWLTDFHCVLNNTDDNLRHGGVTKHYEHWLFYWNLFLYNCERLRLLRMMLTLNMRRVPLITCHIIYCWCIDYPKLHMTLSLLTIYTCV